MDVKGTERGLSIALPLQTPEAFSMLSIEPKKDDWAEYEKAHPIIVSPELADPHPITLKTMAAHDWQTERFPKTSKPGWKDVFRVRVSEFHRDRALKLIDALLKACDTRGFDLRHDDKNHEHYELSVFVVREAIPIALIERGKVVTHLSLEIGQRHRDRVKAWKDRPLRPLETRLNEVMIGVRSMAATRIAERRWWEEDRRKQKEFRRQRAELQKQVEDERKAVDALMGEAEDWRRAINIRAYVRAVKAQAARNGDVADNSDWIAWANEQADRLDPLVPSPPSVLDTPYDAYREPGWEEYIDEDGNIAHA